MSDLLSRPLLRTGAELPEYPRPAVVGAAIAAGWAALAGALLCAAVAVIGWLGAEGGTAPDAARVGLSAWLLAHRVPVDIGGATFGLAPLGLTVVPVLLLHRAGGWVAHTCAIRGRRDVGIASVTLAVGYGGLSTLLAVIARVDGLGPHPAWAALCGGLLAGVVGGFGIVRRSHVGRAVWRRLPTEAQASCYGGLTGFLALAACGGVLVTIALVRSFDRAVAMGESLGAGVVGGAVVFVLCLAYLPNAVVYAVAYACGPGFALGTTTAVTPDAVHLGPVPAFPLLAMVPSEPPAWGSLVLVVPLIAGALAGLVAVRRRPVGAPEAAAIRGGLAGAAGGLAFAVPVLLSRGQAGPGRLVEVGPPAGQLTLVLVVGLALSGAVVAAAVRIVAHYRARVRQRADVSETAGTTSTTAKTPPSARPQTTATTSQRSAVGGGVAADSADVAQGPRVEGDGAEGSTGKVEVRPGRAGTETGRSQGTAAVDEDIDDGIELPEFVAADPNADAPAPAEPGTPAEPETSPEPAGEGVATTAEAPAVSVEIEEPIPDEDVAGTAKPASADGGARDDGHR